MTNQDPRERLRRAVEQDRAARQADVEAQQAAVRGRRAVDAARATLAAHDATDVAVARHHADRIRAGSSGTTGLPPELHGARLRQSAARQALDDAQAASAILDSDEAQAFAAAEAAARELVAAIDAVRAAEAVKLLERVRAAEVESGRLRMMIADFMASRPISAPKLPEVLQLLHADHYAVPMVRAAESAGARQNPAAWSTWTKALLADPDAELAA